MHSAIDAKIVRPPPEFQQYFALLGYFYPRAVVPQQFLVASDTEVTQQDYLRRLNIQSCRQVSLDGDAGSGQNACGWGRARL